MLRVLAFIIVPRWLIA